MKSVFTALILSLFLLSVNTVYAANVTTEQVTNTSTVVKSYMETNHTLPSGVDVGENPVSRSQYLQLSTITVLNINNDSNATIHINSCNNLAYPSESSSSRNINKTEYLDIANRVNIFINNYGIAPNYASTRTGTIRYESLIYIYSQILNSYRINGVSPDYVIMNTWAVVSNPNTVCISMEDINNASGRVKNIY